MEVTHILEHILTLCNDSNSVDHGLETPEVRRALGKDPSGKIVLQAFHDSGTSCADLRRRAAWITSAFSRHARRKNSSRGARLSEARFITSYFSQDFDAGQSV